MIFRWIERQRIRFFHIYNIEKLRARTGDAGSRVRSAMFVIPILQVNTNRLLRYNAAHEPSAPAYE
jgi:hypothetical protein